MKKKIIQGIKKNVIPLGLCIVITGLCWSGLFLHYQGGGFAHGLIQSLETSLLDMKYLVRGEKKTSSKIGVLAIDEKSIQKFGRWPFERKFYAQVFQNLKEAGVSWVGFDVIFSEPEKPTIGDLQNQLSQEIKPGQGINLKDLNATMDNLNRAAPGDRSLAEAIAEFENIVMGYFYLLSEAELKAGGLDKNPFRGLETMADMSALFALTPEDRELNTYPYYLKAAGIIPNVNTLTGIGEHFGFFSNEPDTDAIIRWVTLVKVIDDQLMPSLSLKLAAESMDRDIAVFFDGTGVESIALVNREDDSDTIEIPVDPLGAGRLMLNHLGPTKSIPHFSMVDAYEGNFTDEEKEYLQGSMLILGPTAIGINDQRPNPFDPALPGVENHAAAVDNIVSQQFMTRPTSIYETELYILLAIGIIFSPIIVFSSAVRSGVLMLMFLAGYYYFDKLFWFEKEGIWVYMGVPFIEIVSIFVSVTLYKYFTEEREKKKVKGVFSHYLSKEVIDQVLDDPDGMSLGGVRKDLTVFFSDVRGFTTISESLTPEKLCEFMNDYFTPMTSIILSTKGTLDKYIGDAIMAFWGAPISLDDQAERALYSSIQMLYALDKVQHDFKEKGFPFIDIGIGLNSGQMSVGNMGSGERYQYTVMGDAVNLGARLEGLTKEYGIKLMISEFTQALLPEGKYFTRDLDDIKVKGKNEPVKVFDVLRPDVLKDTGKIKELVGYFEEGRKLYRAQDWKGAEKAFMECSKLKVDDGPTALYMKRVQQFMAKSPGEQWDGVYTFTHK